MLIVQITSNFFSSGSVMLRSRQETKALLNAGHRVIVLTDLRHRSQFHYFKNQKAKPKIIPIKFFLIYGFRSVSAQIIFAFKSYFALKSLARKEKIDLIVEHSGSPFASARFSKLKIAPTVWIIHDLIKYRMMTGNPYNKSETLLRLIAYKYSLSRIKYLIPTSILSKKLLIKDGVDLKKVFIKYNPVDTLAFSPNNDVEKDIDVLFIGRFSVEKGVDILINAVRYLPKDLKVVLIGDGPLMNILKQQAKKIDHKIKFEGFVPFQTLPNFIQRAKILVAPSRSECHPYVPLFSLACGVPVIASRVSGIEDSIENNKSGWLLNQNNAESLGNLIKEVLSKEDNLKTISQNALKRAQFFSENKFSREIITFYENLVKTDVTK